MKKAIKRSWPYLFIFFCILAFFRESLLPPEGKIIYGSDLNDQFFFWKSFFVESIKQGQIPFWNPYSFSGTPFLAHPSVSPFYPLNLIFLIFPINLAFSLFLFVHLLFASYFMFWFAGKKLDTVSSLVSAVIFSLSGFFAARIFSGHIDIISTVSYMPLVFGSITSAINSRDKRYIFLSVISLTLMILAGYQFAVLITLEMVLIYLMFNVLISEVKLKIVRGLRQILVFLFIVICSYGLSAVQFLPTYEFVRNSIRSEGLPYGLVTWGSYSFSTFKLFISPFYFGNPFPESYSYVGPGPNFFELFFFVGRSTLILIAISFTVFLYNLVFKKKMTMTGYRTGLTHQTPMNHKTSGVKSLDTARLRKSCSEWIFVFISILFFSALAMGKNLPFHKLFYNLFFPYRMFRFPPQHLMAVSFILSYLAGYAMVFLRDRRLKIVIVLIITSELLLFGKQFIRTANIPTKGFDQALTSRLGGNEGIYRVLPDYPVVSSVRKKIDFEASSYYKIYSTSGYNPIILDNYYKFVDKANGAANLSLPYYNVEIPPPNPKRSYIDFLNVRYILVDPDFDQLKGDLPDDFRLLSEQPGYKLIENTSYTQRFFLTKDIRYYRNFDEVGKILVEDKLNLSNQVLIKKENSNISLSSDCVLQEDDSVEIVRYDQNNILLKVRNSCDAVLSSSEVYYPGWKAKIDGKVQNIILSNYAFRSLFIPKGDHTVEFYYRPTIYYVGGAVSLTTATFLLGIFWKLKGKKQEEKS